MSHWRADQLARHFHELGIEEQRVLTQHVHKRVQVSQWLQLFAEAVHDFSELHERGTLWEDILVGYLCELHALAPAQPRYSLSCPSDNTQALAPTVRFCTR